MRRNWLPLLAVLFSLLLGAAGVPSALADERVAPPGGEGVSQPEGQAAAEGIAPPLLVTLRETRLDERPVLALRFSRPLDPARDHNRHLQVSRGGEPVGGGWVMKDDPRLLYFPFIQPQSRYRVRVDRGLSAADGSRPAETRLLEVTTREVPAAVGFPSQGWILPPGLTRGLPVMSVNVPRVDVEFLRVRDDKLPDFLRTLFRERPGRWWNWRAERLAKYADSVFLGRYDTGGEPNVRTITHLPVEEMPPLQRPGLYVAVLTRPGHFEGYHVTFFMVSDLGLHLRAYARGMTLHAASLATGKPLEGVAVTLYSRQGGALRQGVSDAQGTLRLDGALPRNGVLVARRGAQISLLDLAEPALDLAEFTVDGPPFRALALFPWLPRDLFRPGEVVDLSLLLRDHDGRMAAPQPVALRLLQPNGDEVLRRTMTPQEGELGYYHTRLSLPADAMTGHWRVELRNDPASPTPAASIPFRVEEFMPERMKLLLESRQEGEAGPTDPWRVAVTGSHLYGAPAAGNAVDGEVSWRFEPHPFAALPEFHFGDADDTTLGGHYDLEPQTLDTAGRLQLALPPRWGEHRSPLAVTLVANLREGGGRPVTRALRRVVPPAGPLVGVRPAWQGEAAPSGETVSLDLARVTRAGEPLPGGAVKATVIREEREAFWTYDAESSWDVSYSDDHYPIHEQTLTLDGGGRGSLSFPVAWGAYRVELRDADNGLLTRYRFHAGWREGNTAERGARPDRVTLAWDKPAYRPGDMAKLSITPPHGGEALILVEGDDVLYQTRLPVPPQGREVIIPVGHGWDRHDLYATVVLLRPVGTGDATTPKRALGVLHLPLAREERRLAVSLALPELARPETTLPVAVRVAGLAPGEPAMVTVAAVDMGILNITGFDTPDPFGHFFARRRFGVEGYDLYRRVIERHDGPTARLNYGGDADALRRGQRARATPRLVSLFRGPVTVDAEGRATVNLDLPAFNGALRVMAVAFGRERFGSGSGEVTVRAPLVAELSMPRFLASGDGGMVALELHNLSGASAPLTVELAASPPLVMAPVRRTLDLASDERRVLRFPVSGAWGFGSGTFTLTVQGEGWRQERQWRLMVRPPYPEAVRRLRGVVPPGDAFPLPRDWAAGLVPETVRGELVLDHRPPLGFRRAVRGLLHYPYGCLEQTTSRAFPWLYATPERLAHWGLPAVAPEERAKSLAQALERLRQLQQEDGGFVLWPGSTRREPWLSAYAMAFLLAARDAGVAVPEEMLERGVKYLQGRLRRGEDSLAAALARDGAAEEGFPALAYGAYVLSRVNQAPLNQLRVLDQLRREEAVGGLPLIHLGLALSNAGDGKRGAELVAAGVDSLGEGAGNHTGYGSPLRDLGWAVALLSRHGMDARQSTPLLARLAAYVGDRSHFSTQEQMAIFRTGMALLGEASTPPLRGVDAAGRVTALAPPEALRIPLDHGVLQAGVTAQPVARGNRFALAAISGYPRQAPPPVSRGITLQRHWYRADGTPWRGEPLRVGDAILVHLRVAAQEGEQQRLDNVLVEDLLPAGMEIINPRLYQGETWDEALAKAGVPPREQREDGDGEVTHQEFLDDRYMAAVKLPFFHGHGVHLVYRMQAVTPGRYSVPPPLAEAMYQPEKRAVGESGDPLVIQEPDAAGAVPPAAGGRAGGG